MPRTVRAVAVALTLLLAACAAAPSRQVQPPTVVHDTITRYVAIPAALTAPLAVPERASNFVLAVVDAYNRRGETILQCNRRLATIRSISGEVVPAAAASAPRPP